VFGLLVLLRYRRRGPAFRPAEEPLQALLDRGDPVPLDERPGHARVLRRVDDRARLLVEDERRQHEHQTVGAQQVGGGPADGARPSELIG